MKINENAKEELQIDLPKIETDNRFRYYDKKLKKEMPAYWIDETPLKNSNHAYAFLGIPGSGKTSMMVSLLTSMKKNCRVYCGCFDTIILNINKNSLSSIGGNPFKKIIEQDQVYEEFDLNFIEEVIKICEINREDDKHTVIIIDDIVTRLRSSKKVHDKFVDLLNIRRHYNLSIWVLAQDLMQLSPSIRNSMNCLFIWRPVNLKRLDLLRTEYLDFNHEDFEKFCDYVYQKNYDCLFVDLKIPVRYYRNFKLLSIEK